MKNRTTTLLLILFFCGLAGLWLADWARLPTAADRSIRAGRVLPELIDVTPAEIGRVTIEGGPERLVLERRGNGWRLVEPIDAEADRSRVEALIQSLRNLPRPADAVPLTGPPTEYGLQPPVRTIRLFQLNGDALVAGLEVGRETKKGRYVRPTGSREVEVADAPPFAAIEQPANAWRERNLVRTPGFEVARLTVEGPGHKVGLERVGDRWRLTEPIQAPADSAKVEGLIASLTALRVIDGPEGFQRDDAKDLAPFGLDKPSWTIRLTSRDPEEPEDRIQIGRAVPDQAGKLYARRLDSKDVVVIDGSLLDPDEIDPYTIRSRRVADLDPSRVDRIRVVADGIEHLLVRAEEGWRVASPVQGEADPALVESLISELDRLEISDLIDPAKASNPGLDPASVLIEVWEDRSPTETAKPTVNARDEPRLTLRLGRRDAASRVLHAQASGDPAILALPLDALEQPFLDRLAFLDHRLSSDRIGSIRRVTIDRQDRSITLEAATEPRDYVHWRMVAPLEAAVDSQSVAMLDATLTNLRADRLIEQGTVDPAAHGLDQPALMVHWTTGIDDKANSQHELRIGDPVEDGDGARFAMIAGKPLLFTLGPRTLDVLEADFHDRSVLSFDPSSVERLVFREGQRETAFHRTRKPFTGGTEWTPEPGSAPSRVRPLEIDGFLAGLGRLQAVRFRQYQGQLPETAGLGADSLVIEMELRSSLGVRRLRLGQPVENSLRLATTATGPSGPVFLIPDPGPPWVAPFREPEPGPELPANPFASDP